MKTKQEVMEFLKEKYNPDKTTIELADLWDFFGITEEDLRNDAEKDACQEKAE